MNVRLSFIVFLFSVYFVHAWNPSKDLCQDLPSMDFEASVAYVQDGQIESDELPPRKTNKEYAFDKEGQDFEYQNENDNVIINVTQRHPNGQRQDVQILDDTGLFSTYVSVLNLAKKVREGRSVSQRDTEIVEEYLNKLSDTMDDLDDVVFSFNEAEDSLEKVFDILHEKPLDVDALYEEVHRMTYFTYNGGSKKHSGSAQIRGYMRTRTENGWGEWQIYRGPSYWAPKTNFDDTAQRNFGTEVAWDPRLVSWVYKGSPKDFPEQFFIALTEQAEADESRYICSEALAQSYLNVRPVAVGYQRGLLSAAKRLVFGGSDSGTENTASSNSSRNVRASSSGVR